MLAELSLGGATQSSPLLLGGMNTAINESKSMIDTGDNTEKLLRASTATAIQLDIDPDMLAEFRMLDEKAKKQNFDKARPLLDNDLTQEEENRYLELIEIVAQSQVEKYESGTDSADKALLYKNNMEQSSLLEHESAQDFIKDQTEAQILHRNLWASIGRFFSAYLVEIPDITQENLRYKLYIQESHPNEYISGIRFDDFHLFVFEQNFSSMPTAVDFRDQKLLVYESQTNKITRVKCDDRVDTTGRYSKVYKHESCLPDEVKIIQNLSSSEADRIKMA